MTTPEPRPALRRADDAGVHPALSVAPSQAPPPPFSTRDGSDGGAVTGGKGGKGGKLKVAEEVDRSAQRSGSKRAKGSAKSFRSAGHATSDAVRTSSDKLVPLDVRIPKSTRKQLRAVAKQSSTPVDELVAAALREWLGDPRRW